jgi:hypothetical protein
VSRPHVPDAGPAAADWRALAALVALALALALVLVAGVARAAVEAPLWEREIVLPDTQDEGQYFGTLLEIRDRAGALVAVAGFPNGSQTNGVNNHRDLHFALAAPPGSTVLRRPAVEELAGRPYGPVSLFRLLTHRGQLIAYPWFVRAPLRTYSLERRRWETVESLLSDRTRRAVLVSLQVVEDSLLATFVDDLVYGDRRIGLDDLPITGGRDIATALYARGRLLLSMTERSAADPSGRSLLIDCAWRPGWPEVQDCRRVEFPAVEGARGRHAVNGMHPLADGRVLVYGLSGFLHLYAQGTLHPLVEIDPARSWQAYSSLEHYGRLLLGQYPAGNLMVVSLGDSLARSPDDPPWSDAERGEVEMTPAVSSSERRRDEAQSVMYLGTDLAVGMWPWGEVFGGRPGGAWRVLLASPVGLQPDAGGLHPFETKVGNNCLGMRVFQLMPWRGGVVFQNTPKNGDAECQLAAGKVSPADLRPYGRVRYLDVPGSLSCPLIWTGRPRQIRLRLTRDGSMTVEQDGRLLCRRPVDEAVAMARRLNAADNEVWIRPAIGFYGRATGEGSRNIR